MLQAPAAPKVVSKMALKAGAPNANPPKNAVESKPDELVGVPKLRSRKSMPTAMAFVATAVRSTPAAPAHNLQEEAKSACIVVARAIAASARSSAKNQWIDNPLTDDSRGVSPNMISG
jgi:hypothetical protein